MRAEDYPAIAFAVTVHCDGEPVPADPHYRLAALLKDADGLDRVRLGDLDPRRLRHDQARSMVPFAQALFEATDGVLVPGRGYFSRLWPEAMRLTAWGAGGMARVGASSIYKPLLSAFRPETRQGIRAGARAGHPEHPGERTIRKL